MRMLLRRSAHVLGLAGLALVLAGGGNSAGARMETLVWEHPSSGEVAGFKIHYGSASGSYTQVLDVGRPARASDGSFSHALAVADTATIYVAISAYAADGRVSPLSNERVRAPDPTSGGTGGTGSGGSTDDSGSGGTGGSGDAGTGGTADPDGSSGSLGTAPNTLWFEDFEASALGTFLPGWIDTAAGNSLAEDDTLFEVISLGGDRVLATSSSATDIHSHHVGSLSAGWTSYEVRARVRADDALGRLGISSHSGYPGADVYYRLGTAWKTGELEIQSHPWFDEIGVVCADTGTGVVLQPDLWYRLRLQVEVGATETHIRAKAWVDGQPEPAIWQAQCSQGDARLPVTGTVGVWSGRAGAKFWDDFEVLALPQDVPASPDPGAAPLGPPARPVLILE